MDFISEDFEPGDSFVLVADTRHIQFLKRSKAKRISVVSSREKPLVHKPKDSL